MLIVRDLRVAYGKTLVLTGVSLAVAQGEIVSIIGRNGVGKTTLLKALIGLLPAQAGTIALHGEDLAGLPAHVRARRGFGYVPQGRMIFGDLSVEENLLLGAELNRATSRQLLDEVLEEFPRLRDRLRQRGGTLSGGEQQMLALARALVGAPKLLLLDEPSAGIQPSIIQEIEARIAAANRARGLTILLVEQNIEFAASLSQRVYVMDKGRIAREILPHQVMDEDIVRAYLAV
jgi:branched-chain amino acid transport system ATP-binding protein